MARQATLWRQSSDSKLELMSKREGKSKPIKGRILSLLFLPLCSSNIQAKLLCKTSSKFFSNQNQNFSPTSNQNLLLNTNTNLTSQDEIPCYLPAVYQHRQRRPNPAEALQ
jgi:hypothetical protein